jgi:hypothetical protein
MDRKKCDIIIKAIDSNFKWNTLKIRGNIIINDFDNSTDVIEFYCQLATEIRNIYNFKLVIIIGISLVEEKNGN